jgi:hypothetical protein
MKKTPSKHCCRCGVHVHDCLAHLHQLSAGFWNALLRAGHSCHSPSHLVLPLGLFVPAGQLSQSPALLLPRTTGAHVLGGQGWPCSRLLLYK